MTKPALLMTGAYPAGEMEALEKEFDLLRLWEAPDQAAFIAAHAPHIRAIATRGDLGASGQLIAQLPKLEMIGCFGVGVDGIDLAACRARGIAVSNTPDVLTEDVADLAFALMLGIARHIAQADAFTRAGLWAKGSYPLLTRLNRKRLGILGLGRIGMAIARRAEGFAMDISYCTRNPVSGVAYKHYGSAAELAAHSDFLVAIVPGGAATHNLVDEKVLTALGPNGFFINVARGSVVDENALLAALEAKAIAGAALDVFWNEPAINPRFFPLQNVVLHPHGGSGTVETRRAMGQLVRDNLAAHFAGRPLLTPV
ncbi:MAG: 2-hydroxyacid dehydrogenase [Hyphomicrobiales bacterium]